jgi:hypothetical protein
MQTQIEINAAVVVEDALGAGQHILLVGDHKQTASLDSVADVQEIPNRIRYAYDRGSCVHVIAC